MTKYRVQTRPGLGKMVADVQDDIDDLMRRKGGGISGSTPVSVIKGTLPTITKTKESTLTQIDEYTYSPTINAWSWKSKCIAKTSMSDLFKLSKVAYATWGVMEAQAKVGISGDMVNILISASEYEPTVGQEVNNTPANNFIVWFELSTGAISSTSYYDGTGKTYGVNAYACTPNGRLWMTAWICAYNGFGYAKATPTYVKNLRALFLTSLSCFDV